MYATAKHSTVCYASCSHSQRCKKYEQLPVPAVQVQSVHIKCKSASTALFPHQINTKVQAPHGIHIK